jgi:hypothetical protein
MGWASDTVGSVAPGRSVTGLSRTICSINFFSFFGPSVAATCPEGLRERKIPLKEKKVSTVGTYLSRARRRVSARQRHRSCTLVRCRHAPPTHAGSRGSRAQKVKVKERSRPRSCGAGKLEPWLHSSTRVATREGTCTQGTPLEPPSCAGCSPYTAVGTVRLHCIRIAVCKTGFEHGSDSDVHSSCVGRRRRCCRCGLLCSIVLRGLLVLCIALSIALGLLLWCQA